MSLNKRTKYRLLIVSIVFAVFFGSVLTAYLVREGMLETQASESLVTGYEAFEAHDYEKAVDQIGRGIQRKGDAAGAEAFYRYGMARLEVPLPNSQQVVQAASSLRHAVDLDPSYVPALDELLNINIAMGRDTEAQVLADEVLAVNPDSIAALRAKTIVLQRARKLEEALAVAQHLNEVDPENLSFHYMTLSLLQDLGKTDTQLLEYAQKLRDLNTNNPAFTVLLARVLLSVDQQEQAVVLLKQAAQNAVGSPSAADIVSQMELLGVGLENVELLALARQVAEQTLAQQEVPELRTWLLQQAWEQGQIQGLFADASVAAILDGQSTAPAMDHALVVLSLLRTQKQEQADAILDAMASRMTDPKSVMWAKVIRAISAKPQPSASELVTLCREALRVDPANPYFRYWLAESLAKQGETDEAIQVWRQVVSQRPSWWLPLVRLSRAYLNQGDTQSASKIAGSAVGLHRNNSEVIVAWSQAMMAHLADRDDAANHKLLQSIRSFRQAWPKDERLMLMEMGMLIRLDEKQAAATLAKSLIDAQQMSQASLFKMVQMSQQAGLNLENDALTEVRSRFGQTPEVVLVEAMKKYQAGQGDEGRAMLDEALASADASEQVAYALAQARYLELSGDEDTLKTWRHLGETYRDNARVQTAILNAQSTWSDRALIRETLRRLGDQVGSTDIAWREAQARWLIESQQGDRDIAAGAQIASQIVRQQPRRVEARLLLANAMSRLKNLAAAREQLEQIVELRPELVDVRLNLAQMNYALGDTQRAVSQLREIAARSDLNAQQIQRLIPLAVTLHEDEMVLALLNDPQMIASDSSIRLLALADVAVRRHEFAQAGERLAQVVGGDLDEAALEQVIRLYFEMGELDQIRALDAAIAQTPMPEVNRFKLQAQAASLVGDFEVAVASLEKGLAVEPGDVDAWFGLIRAQMVLGELPAATAVAQRALAAVPQSAAMASLVEAMTLAADHPEELYLPILVRGGINHPDHLPALVQAMQALASQGWSDPPSAALVGKLRQLADRHPDVVLLQNLFAQALLESGDSNTAIELALRTMQAHGDDEMSAQMAAQALFAQQQWSQAMAAAQAWRDRAKTQTLPADLMIANLQLQKGDALGCLETLAPYLTWAQAHPQDAVGLLGLEAQAMGRLGQWDQVEDLLRPLLASGPAWSEIWIEVGMRASSSPQEAARWLGKLASELTASDVAGQVGLVRAYITLGQSSPELSGLLEKAHTLAQSLAKQGGLSESQWLLLGVAGEQLGDVALAQTSYRQALATGEPIHQAANNLAMVLLEQSEALDEALEWSQQALAWNGEDPNYWDTLGQVHLKRNEISQGIQAFERAHELDPDDPQWVLELARAAIEADELDRARQWLSTFDAYRWSGRPLSQAQSDRLKAMQATLKL